MRVVHMIAKEESWFSSKLMQASLLSVISVVDKVILVDNGCSVDCREMYTQALVSGQNEHGTLWTVSDCFGEKDFSKLRNRCFEQSEAGDLILKLDADDVHYADGVNDIFKKMETEPNVGCVFGNFVHHRRDPWLQDKTGTHLKDIFFRQTPEMRWEKGVHEGVVGILGDKKISSYLYHHFGYTKSRQELLAHWINYDILEFGEVRRYNLKSFKDLDPGEDLHGQFKVEENKKYEGSYPKEVSWMFDGTMEQQGLRWTERGLEGSDFNPLKEHINEEA